MKTQVLYKSRTGNTELLAKWLAEEVCDCIYCGNIENSVDAQIYYVGFWTDKGDCTDKVKNFLEKLHGKKIYLFGTAGFGADEEYFKRILNRVKKYIPEDNTVEGTFMCQGKMPKSVRYRYEKMLTEPEKAAQAEMFIKNFDMAASHPDNKDRENLINQFKIHCNS